MPIYTDLINSLPETVPFVGPETDERARGRSFAARLGANENVFGPSPFAIQAMAQGRMVFGAMVTQKISIFAMHWRIICTLISIHWS